MMDKKVVSRELSYLLLGALLGFILLPCVIAVVVDGSVECMRDFYTILAGVRDASYWEREATWAVAAGPYLLLQLIRPIVWVGKRLIS